MNGLQITYLVILGTCILASGFFSGSETALIGIGRERVHRLAARDKRGGYVEQLVADTDRLLSTLLVANNVVNILGASVATALFIDLLGEDWGPWAATVVVTTAILVIGEITPKTLATRYPEGFSLAVGPTIWRLSRVLAPVGNFFTSITRTVLRLVGATKPEDSGVTEDDIRAMVEMGAAGGEIEAVEHEIIDALFGLADRPVREVMTPRVDIHPLARPVTMAAVRSAVSATGHSRFPVTDGDLDHLLGILYVKDLLRSGTDPSSDDIARMVRAPYYVPESAAILTVLQELRRRRIAFGVVLDEHGGVEGVVTIKDLVSELVGELHDEYDPGAPAAVRIGPRQWLADGRLPVEDLAAALGLELPTGPYSTVAGLFMTLAGKIPAEGDGVADNGMELTVLRMERNHIDRLRVDMP